MKESRRQVVKHGRRNEERPPERMRFEGVFRYGILPLLLVCVATFLAIHPITDPDFWYHAAFGREAWDKGSIPQQDMFSHTAAGHYWVSSGWLPDIFLHVLHSRLGPPGPIGFVAIVVTVTALIIYLTAARRWGAGWVAALVITAGVFMAYPRYNPRPDVMSFLIISLLCLLLVAGDGALKENRSPRFLWFVPLLLVAWVNLHALFFLGVLLTAGYAAWNLWLWKRSGKRMHLDAALPCCTGLVVWLANPYGWRVLRFVYDNATMPDVGKRVFELKPLFGGGPTPIHMAFAVMAFFGLAGAIAWNARRSIPLWRWAAILFFGALAFYQRRQIGLAAFAIPALLVPELGALQKRLARWNAAGLGAVAMAAVMICGLRVGGVLEVTRGWPLNVDCQWFPCQAAQFLKLNPPPQNLFHDLYTGGYLLHELGPETKVFIDGRLEVYKGAPWNDYFGPVDGTLTTADLFAKYGVKTCVLDIRGSVNNPGSIAVQLARKPDWKLVYFDDQYGVLVHEEPGTADYLKGKVYEFVNPLNRDLLMKAYENPGSRAKAIAEAQRAVTDGSQNSKLASSALRDLTSSGAP